MLNAAKIEHRTYLTLPGATAPMNVKELTNDQLLNGIKTCEDEVERLKALKARSKFVAKQIKDLQAGIDQMVEILDARVVEDDEPKAKAK